MEEPIINETENQEEHIIVKKDKYVLKKLAAFDLLLAHNKTKTISMSGILISVIIYGAYVINQLFSMILAFCAMLLFAYYAVTSERKIKYYEKQYDIKRPAGVMQIIKSLNQPQPEKDIGQK